MHCLEYHQHSSLELHQKDIKEHRNVRGAGTTELLVWHIFEINFSNAKAFQIQKI